MIVEQVNGLFTDQFLFELIDAVGGSDLVVFIRVLIGARLRVLLLLGRLLKLNGTESASQWRSGRSLG